MLKPVNWHKIVSRQIGLSVLIILQGIPTALALPPAEDIPEEVLRTEMITEGRSPVDGQPLSPAEYALLEEQLAQGLYSPALNPKIRHLIFLLRIRKVIRTIIPFYP
jgi:hypothetical protein